MKESPTGSVLHIGFTLPVQYLRHTPRARGEFVQIQLSPLAVSETDKGPAFGRESLRLPPDSRLPVRDVTYEGDVEDGPFLNVQFSEPVDFEVRQGKDFRSLIVAVRRSARPGGRHADRTRMPKGLEMPKGPRPPESGREPAKRVEGEVAVLMEEARVAMAEGQFSKAIGIYTKVLEHPDGRDSPEALEYLGLARERNGQLAHAVSEYEEYLARHPGGVGAARVQQRLDALLTRSTEPADTLRPARRAPTGFEYDVFGSLSTVYSRFQHITGIAGGQVADSSLFADTNLTARARNDDYGFTFRWAGRYGEDFLDSGFADDLRISTLFLEAEDRRRGLSGTLGRQSRSSGGVLGRFDGALLGYRLDERLQLGLVGGLPLESSRSIGIQTDKYFYGVSLDAGPIAEYFDGQIFAVDQIAHGIRDRTAVGGELRYADGRRYGLAFIDYDVHHRSLNTALMTGSWQLSSRTAFNALIDRRNSPILTTSNALQGQFVDDLSELLEQYSRSEIEALAEDRTARSTAFTVGASQRLREDLQIAGDVTATHFSGTSSSGGIEATDSTGWEIAYFAQLIANDLVMEGDTAIASVRYFAGSTRDTVTLTLNGRYPVASRLRLNPRLRVDYDRRADINDELSLAPLLRIDYRPGHLVFDTQVGLEWEQRFGSNAPPDELGYLVEVGVRWDF